MTTIQGQAPVATSAIGRKLSKAQERAEADFRGALEDHFGEGVLKSDDLEAIVALAREHVGPPF